MTPQTWRWPRFGCSALTLYAQLAQTPRPQRRIRALPNRAYLGDRRSLVLPMPAEAVFGCTRGVPGRLSIPLRSRIHPRSGRASAPSRSRIAVAYPPDLGLRSLGRFAHRRCPVLLVTYADPSSIRRVSASSRVALWDGILHTLAHPPAIAPGRVSHFNENLTAPSSHPHRMLNPS